MTYLPELFGPTALLVASIAAYIEVRRREGASLVGELAALAAAMLALQLGLHTALNGSIDVLVYTHLWAAYLTFAYLQVKRRAPAENADALKYLALAIFSVPTALRALNDPTGGYSVLLLAEHAGLAVVGEALKRRDIVKWAAIVIVLAVVYMLRDFTYVITGIVALTLVGYVIYKLSKNDTPPARPLQ